MKYAWIAKHKGRWPITLACDVLGVSASGYFEHWRRKDTGEPSKPGANRRISDEGLLVHIKAIHAEVKQELSDRGSQYCSHKFQKALADDEIKSSMSCKGDGWDNSPTESPLGRLKVGGLYGRRFETRREAMDEMMDWLNFYNHKKFHSTLGNVRPITFEKRWIAAQQQDRKSA